MQNKEKNSELDNNEEKENRKDNKNNFSKESSEENSMENKSSKDEEVTDNEPKKEDHEKVEENKKEALLEELKKNEKEKIIEDYIDAVLDNEKLKLKLAEKENESQSYLDKYRRALADQENLRKRTVLDKQEAMKYSNFNIISDLLTILDDFQRAIDSARNDEKTELKNFVDGIDMIEKHFSDLLFKKYGVVRYGEKEEDFDPKIHRALMLEDGEYEKETVVEVFRKGYLLHDRVIRPAEVKIGRPKQ